MRSTPYSFWLVPLLLLAGDPQAPVTAPAIQPTTEATVTIFRCIDAKGRVSLQDDPCPKTSTQSERNMVRPQDPPKASGTRPAPAPAPAPIVYPPSPPPELIYDNPPMPPPPMYECTSYDGIVRESEVYDPNPRCEPLALYYPDPQYLTPEQANLCHWVRDSCVRLSNEETCARWKAKRKEAESAYRSAFSDAPYRKSELARINQIINESCR